MNLVAPLAFAVILLLIGLLATFNPSGIRSFYERLGVRSSFAERTVLWSIRVSGVIALVMAAFVGWASLRSL
jgi:hypothetical protein